MYHKLLCILFASLIVTACSSQESETVLNPHSTLPEAKVSGSEIINENINIRGKVLNSMKGGPWLRPITGDPKSIFVEGKTRLQDWQVGTEVILRGTLKRRMIGSNSQLVPIPRQWQYYMEDCLIITPPDAPGLQQQQALPPQK